MTSQLEGCVQRGGGRDGARDEHTLITGGWEWRKQEEEAIHGRALVAQRLEPTDV